MKLSFKQANLLFVLLVSIAMTAVMSFGILLMRLGWQADFLKIWFGDFLLGCGLSIPTGFTVVPLIRRWIDRQIVPADVPVKPTSYSESTMAEVVQELVSNYAETLNNHQAGRFAWLFHEDAEYNNVMGTVIRGRKALADWHAPLFDGRGREIGMPDFSRAIIEVSRYELRPVTADVALVHVFWTQYGAISPAGAVIARRSGLSAWVVTFKGGNWRIDAMNNKDLPD